MSWLSSLLVSSVMVIWVGASRPSNFAWRSINLSSRSMANRSPCSTCGQMARRLRSNRSNCMVR